MKPFTENEIKLKRFFEMFPGCCYTREELCTLTGLSDRKNRDIINSLRRHNPPVMIISYPGKAGYYLSNNEDEWDFQCKRQVRRLARGCFRRVKTYRRQLRFVS
jgi:hypothetical protein